MTELRIAITAYALLAALVLAAVIGLRQRVGIALLVLLSVVWLNVDRDFEGPVLVDVGHGHGLVLADLVGVAGLCAAAWLAVISLRAGRRQSHRPPG
jgi:hypothetical protein